ncbi:MAG: hypothetical protein DI566_06525 [Microbacterium sp.]|nr:MAG: hypothetical protein DI566_06525 [Microbacterium sp.]
MRATRRPYRLRIFVPASEVDGAVGADADGAGSLNFSNLVGDFDPTGVSGASNYGSGFEPGYCADGTPSSTTGTPTLNCNTMEDNSRSNNVVGPNGVTISPGSWSKYNFDLPTGWVHSEKLLPGAAASHDGAATLQPGQFGASDIRIGNGGINPMTGIQMCDIFDNTTMKLSTLDKVVDNAASFTGAYDLSTRHAYVLLQAPGEPNANNNAAGRAANLAYQDNWEIQYAHFDFGADNVIGGGFNATYNRYDGTWTNQRSASCADGAAENKTGWVTSVAAAGGIDQINAVRVVAKNGYGLPSAGYAFLKVAYEQRDTFNGGPNAGQKIPAGTVAANFARVRSDSYAPTWTGRGYVPMSATGESGNTDGDRWTVTRAAMSLTKESVTVDGVGTGAATVGNTGAALAGGKVVWKVNSSLTADSQSPAPVNNVVITDTLPRYAVYNEACTAGLTGGTPASSYTVNGDGTTTLVWNLGTLTPNQPIAPRIICTDTDALAPNGTSLTNVAVITSPEVTPVAAHRDDHTVILEQTGELRVRKDVDATLDLADDPQVYSLRLKNFSSTLAVQRPTVIDVLANVGDGTSAGGVVRDPASDFAGTSGLTGPVTAFDWSGTQAVGGTVLYTTIPTASIPQNIDADTNPAIWQTQAQVSANWGAVTGFKFIASGPLAIASNVNASGIVLKYTTTQLGNDPGDLYSNRFTAFSDTFMNGAAHQLLTSNQTVVRVVGFSLGDFIFTDENADGRYTAGTDTPAPAGVTVQVFRSGGATPVATVTTNDAGRWVVNDLPRGDYYVMIPASQFAAGGPLAGRVASTVNSVSDPNTDQNENVDHHAIANAGGIRSAGLVNLDATVAGADITGQEPLGDNVAGLRLSPGTTDAFTNLTLDLALQRVPGYTRTKTAAPASGSTVLPGDSITYTVTGSNTGTAPLEVTVTDDWSEVVAHSAGGTITNNSLIAEELDSAGAVTADVSSGLVRTLDDVTWTGTLVDGHSVRIRYAVVVAVGTEGEILENVVNSTATPDPSIGTPITPAEVTVVHPVAGYTFAKTASPVTGTEVLAGGSVTFTLTGTNTGASALNTVVITDSLADVLDDATVGSLAARIIGPGAPSTAPAPTLTGTTLTWSGSLAAGQSVEVTYVATVLAGAALDASTLVNTATSSAIVPGGRVLTGEGGTSHPVPGYTFTKTSDPASGRAVQGGQTINYTLTGTNTGATALPTVEVTDDLADVLAHAELVAGSLTATVSGVPAATAPTLTDTTITWTGALAVGQRVVITYSVTVDADATGSVLHNVAESTATTTGGNTLTPPPVETFHPTTGFTLSKAASKVSGQAVVAGERLTYTLVGTNAGASTLNPVVVTDDLSGVTPYADLDATSVTATIDGAPATVPVVAGDTLTWTGVLAAGEVVTITYTVVVRTGVASADSVLINRASASATPPDGLPPITTPPVSLRHPIAAFALAKTSNPGSGATVNSGDIIRYTITGTNLGAAMLDPIKIVDEIGKVLQSSTLDGPQVAVVTHANSTTDTTNLLVVNGQLVWEGPLSPGEKVEITYAVKVGVVNSATTLDNSVSATWPEGAVLSSTAARTLHPITVTPLAAAMPNTGGVLPVWLIWVGGGLLLSGLVLLIARRRLTRD